MRYLGTTRSDITITTISDATPNTDRNGFFSLRYSPAKLDIFSSKIRSFVTGVKLVGNSQDFGIHAIRTEIEMVKKEYIIWFQSAPGSVFYLALYLILFDTATPGITIAYGNVVSEDLIDNWYSIDATNLWDLKLSFFGFQSFEFKINSEISMSLEIDAYARVSMPSLTLNFFSADYLVIQLLECGLCSGFPYFYNKTCYASCPPGTKLYDGRCLPISNCGVKNANGVCLPDCSVNEHYSEQRCVCNPGYYRV